ncbi:SDR family oxidoreductase [Candidatus Enterococcus courvalinii]|uniref:SDR family oxidoreductase n=1 Tax=Candidatus Enterococcus courvalinii TaxID=2815329 RepID=A0ABS3I0R7_9ENTE|nr:SDR family oxidoreductase [Enterococcus sp. MSG2901]MBO0481920.1 SDR family oxidoreductase [Enterococcus sp. MSG2901]
MDHILIIGGTGNIGYPLIETLAKNDKIKLTVGVHTVSKVQETFQHFHQLTLVPFDFLDPKTFPKAFEGVNKVFFIRPPQLSKPKEDMAPFLTYAKQQNIEQIVFVSLIGVEKNPVTPHHKIEKMIREAKIPYTFIRPSFFMQNLNTTHQNDIKNNHDLFIPAGHSKTSFIDTRDIGEVAAVCLTNPVYLNQELELTGAKALTYDEIAEVMTTNLDTKITYSKPTLLKFRRVMIQRGIPKDYVNVMVVLYLITQLGNAKKITNTIEQVLNRPPRTIQEYVRDYKNDFIRESH